MSLCQLLLVDYRIQANQNRHLTVSQQVLAKTCHPAPVRHSSKPQLRLRQQVSQKFQYRQVKVVPRLRVT